MATFVLVHGMFHGGWCWDRLKARLERSGHRVIAEDLASCGQDRTPPAEATLARWADDTARAITGAGEPVVLVGHSRGGIVISQTAEAVPDQVAALVYLTALMLPNGMAAFGMPALLGDQDPAAQSPIVPRFTEDGTAMLPPENAEEIFYGNCSPEDRAWAAPQVGAEPLQPVGAPLSLTEARYGRVPRVFVETTLDRTLPIGAQRAMIAHSPPDQVITLEADHMPNVTHVEELAAILEGVARKYAPAAEPA